MTSKKRYDIEETNGGRHTKLGMRYDLVAPEAERIKAQILHEGAIKHKDPAGHNWRRIPIHLHLNHALAHIYDYLRHDQTEDHLGHAYCRLMFAVAIAQSASTQKPATRNQR